MNIYVKSRNDMIKHTIKATLGNDDTHFAIISISGIDEQFPKFHFSTKLKKVLYLQFDDVSSGKPSCMSRMDAIKIRKFIEDIHQYNINKPTPITAIYVHCSAGVSRSAAVAAVLMKYYNGSDMPIFENAYYKPNMHVYTMVLNELFGRDNSEPEKIKFNYTLSEKRFEDEVEIQKDKIKDHVEHGTLDRYIQANQYFIDYYRKEDSIEYLFTKVSILACATYELISAAYSEYGILSLHNYYNNWLKPRWDALKSCYDFLNKTYFDNFGIYEKKKN